MNLNKEQIDQFNKDGYLFFPDHFSKEEVKALTLEVTNIYSIKEEINYREKDSSVVRTNWAAHLYNHVFAKLAKHPRMIHPVEDLLQEKLYMHQFKINGKMAFEGDLWQWHQDFGNWYNGDLMPSPRAMNIAIFLDEVTEHNGPLLFIPGSHKKGLIDSRLDTTTTSYPLWKVNNDTVKELVNKAGGLKGGIVSPTGGVGSMIIFHSCLIHSSSNNLSPFNRTIVYLSLCAVSNHIRRFKRKEYIAHRDFTPIECLPDDCLTKDYNVELPWLRGIPKSAFKTSLDVIPQQHSDILKDKK